MTADEEQAYQQTQDRQIAREIEWPDIPKRSTT